MLPASVAPTAAAVPRIVYTPSVSNTTTATSVAIGSAFTRAPPRFERTTQPAHSAIAMIATANASSTPGDAMPSKLCEDARAVRRVLPLFVLTLVALLPWELFALRAGVASEVHGLRIQLELGWALAATAWMAQLWLVAPSLRAVKPTLVAIVAIVLGLVAGGVPGLVLLVLLAWTAAEASVEASAAAVRVSWRPVAIAVAAMIAVDLAIPLVAQLALVHVPAKKPPPAAFAAGRTYLRAVVAALVVWSPIAAQLIARSRKPRIR